MAKDWVEITIDCKPRWWQRAWNHVYCRLWGCNTRRMVWRGIRYDSGNCWRCNREGDNRIGDGR